MDGVSVARDGSILVRMLNGGLIAIGVPKPAEPLRKWIGPSDYISGNCRLPRELIFWYL